jgi:putative tryptophan/tyrosine transport system substrate-binding protein
MRRREFITLLGGAAAWPLTARAQQPERMRRIGVLISVAADDPEGHTRQAAFLQELAQLGWTVGRNVRFDIRWTAGKADDTRQYVTELVALAPDAILAVGSATVAPLQRATRTIPIVFVNVADPVGAGLVENLARPGGNTTGFTNFEYSMSGKWVELLKQIAPRVTRVAVLRDSAAPVKTQQDVIVAVEDRYASKRCHQRCSVAEYPSRYVHCLIAASCTIPAGNMMSGRDTRVRLQLPAV